MSIQQPLSDKLVSAKCATSKVQAALFVMSVPMPIHRLFAAPDFAVSRASWMSAQEFGFATFLNLFGEQVAIRTTIQALFPLPMLDQAM